MNAPTESRPTSILFVCMGNICRSPTAEGVFRHHVRKRHLIEHFLIDSAGTHGYHAGAPPDERAIAHAAKRGYDLSQLRARPVSPDDFDRFDFILAMDRQNLHHLKSMTPSRCQHKLELLLDYSSEHAGGDVPDPYYGKPRDFERVLDLVEAGCQNLLDFLAARRANIR
jgi:protein-tyrosine phosphatase